MCAAGKWLERPRNEEQAPALPGHLLPMDLMDDGGQKAKKVAKRKKAEARALADYERKRGLRTDAAAGKKSKRRRRHAN